MVKFPDPEERALNSKSKPRRPQSRTDVSWSGPRKIRLKWVLDRGLGLQLRIGCDGKLAGGSLAGSASTLGA